MNSFKRALTIALLSLAHFAASAVALMTNFGTAMRRLDAGTPASFVDTVIDRASTLLYFPLVHLAQLAPREWFAGPLGWLPFAVNSLLWGCLIAWAAQGWRQRQAALAHPDLNPLPPDAPA